MKNHLLLLYAAVLFSFFFHKNLETYTIERELYFKTEVIAVFIFRFFRKLHQFFVDIPAEKETIFNDRYKVIRVLGSGSFGIVYLCLDLQTNEQKAVKQLRPSKRRFKKEVALFKNEISVLHLLKHRNMPVCDDVFSCNGHFFYAMSVIEGASLEDEIFQHKKTFNEKEALLFGFQLLELIDYLHQKNIYHQDLRIPNILLNNNRLFVIDFGLSRQESSSPSLSSPAACKKTVLMLKQQDYYDLGEILLYLLYTTFSSPIKKALPWTEELSLKKETVCLLKKLLGIEKPYSTAHELNLDFQKALAAVGEQTDFFTH